MKPRSEDRECAGSCLINVGCQCRRRATWTNLEDITLSEINQSPKDKYHRITITGHASHCQVHRGTGRMVFARGFEGGDSSALLLNGHRVSILQEEESSGDGCWWRLHNNVNPLTDTELHAYKWLKWWFLCVFTTISKKLGSFIKYGLKCNFGLLMVTNVSY